MNLHTWRPLTAGGGALGLTYSFGPATANTLAVRLDDGSWLVVSPPVGAPAEALEHLSTLGPVTALLANDGFHHLGQVAWRERFPAMIYVKDKATWRAEVRRRLADAPPSVVLPATARPWTSTRPPAPWRSSADPGGAAMARDMTGAPQALAAIEAQVAGLAAEERAILAAASLLGRAVRKEELHGVVSRAAAIAPSLHDAGTPFRFGRACEVLLATRLLVRGEKGGMLTCQPEVAHAAAKAAMRARWAAPLVMAIRTLSAGRVGDGVRWYYRSEDARLDARLALYVSDFEALRTVLRACAGRGSFGFDGADILLDTLPRLFDPPFLDAVPIDLLEVVASLLVSRARALSGDRVDPAWLPYLEARARAEGSPQLRLVLAAPAIWAGRLDDAASMFAEPDEPLARAVAGWISVLRGDPRAVEHFEAAFRLGGKALGWNRVGLPNPVGVFFLLALLQRRDAPSLDKALAHYRSTLRANPGDPHLLTLSRVIEAIRDGRAGSPPLPALRNNSTILHVLLVALGEYWTSGSSSQGTLTHLQGLAESLDAEHHRWFLAEIQELRFRANPTQSGLGEHAASERAAMGIVSLAECVPVRAPWEKKLEALAVLVAPRKASAPAAGKPTRVAWLLMRHGEHISVTPHEQKRDAKGRWSKGRKLGLAGLQQRERRPEYLTPGDHAACDAITVDTRYYRPIVALADTRALAALAGHPAVFWQTVLDAPVEVTRGEVEIHVERDRAGGGLVVRLVPELDPESEGVVLAEGPYRLRVVSPTDQHRALARVLGKGPLAVPDAGREQLFALLPSLGCLAPVHAEGGRGLAKPATEGDATPHLLLSPRGGGLRIEVRVRPLGVQGPAWFPGAGGRVVYADTGAERVAASRLLDEELRRALAVVGSLPGLPEVDPEEARWSWDVPDPEGALEVLAAVERLGDEVRAEWPEGKRLPVPKAVEMSALRIHVQRDGDWFAAAAELHVDEATVLDLQRVLELARGSRGRFVALDKDRILALSEDLRRRLDEIASFGEASGARVRFSPFAALAFEASLAQAGAVKADRHWSSWIARLREAESLECPVPHDLAPVLREYQAAGFQWLARLAHAGLGACLADDMGLGKTLQALALLVHREALGPALVAAPTSVVENWVAEARRFAPSLRPQAFGPGDREAAILGAGPGDLLVTSYGLLLSEAERLASRRWSTIVLDEAQSIKNVATKRSQAAMTLQGDCKVITTGTPIENHLGELWNLFRFINPGLLGSRERFGERFAGPIEKDGDRVARRKLKALIGPFVLRRTKGQVLEELPSRTEIAVHVELPAGERAFYEALRRNALETMARSQGNTGQRHLQVLAELMRLRRACCHPSLVAPEGVSGETLGGAKLATFLEIAQELRDNGHRALVFSQFVDHLSIVRQALDDRHVAYQYLDGATPLAERKKRIDAFQGGAGDFFLLSLRAGGLGINLTAADYVIHLDPWWNPAVEDQASDRAHRLGQTRPVTIYRLIAKDTVESRIVALHHRKRDLAQTLLEGSDVAGRISYDDLVALLAEE